MSSAGSAFTRAIAGAALAVCLVPALFARVGSSAPDGQIAPSTSSEIRALWVLRSSLTSPESIATLVRSASETGFNTIFVQVRGRGDAYYAGGVEPRALELARQPATFDPLGEVLRRAHASGLRVHAWVNVNLVSSATDLPRAREHVVYRHPEWLMVPRQIGQELARVDPSSPGYLGKLARWTRGQSADVEGLYTSPASPAAVEYIESVVRDLTRNYPVDGVHFDYARYPNEQFDYSRSAIHQFRAWIESRLPLELRRQLASSGTDDPFAFPDALPDEWRQFRIDRMTALLTHARDAVKRERPTAVVSVAAGADMREALDRRFQDWAAWLKDGVIDAICPMAYTNEPARFAEQIATARAAAGAHPVWAGIGAYRLSPAQTIDNIAIARRLGARGIVLFSYDSLIDASQSAPNYMTAVARAAFGRSGSAGGSQ